MNQFITIQPGKRVWLFVEWGGKLAKVFWLVYRSSGITYNVPINEAETHPTYHANGDFHTADVISKDSKIKSPELKGRNMPHFTGPPLTNFKGSVSLGHYSINVAGVDTFTPQELSPGDVEYRINSSFCRNGKFQCFIYIVEPSQKKLSQLVADPSSDYLIIQGVSPWFVLEFRS